MSITATLAVLSLQPSVSLRDLGLSEIRVSQLDELVRRLLPVSGPEEPPAGSSIWRSSHVSADSFFHNKHGEQLRSPDFVFSQTVLLYDKMPYLTRFVTIENYFDTVVILLNHVIETKLLFVWQGFHREGWEFLAPIFSTDNTTVL